MRNLHLRTWTLGLLPFVTLLFICVNTNLFAQNVSPKLDSLIQVLENKNLTDNDLFEIYNGIGEEYATNPDKSIHYLKEGIIHSKKTNNNELLITLYDKLSCAYFLTTEYDSVLVYCNHVIELCSVVDITTGKRMLGCAYHNIGLVYTSINRYDEALDHFFRSMKITEELNDRFLLSEIYASIAYTYDNINNYKQAEIYYLKMEENSREAKDTFYLTTAMYSLSSIFLEEKDYEKAMQYAQEAYDITMSFSNVSMYHLMYAHQTLSQVWRPFDLDTALIYAQQALSYAKTYNVAGYTANILCDISQMYLDHNDYVAAERTAHEAMQIVTGNDALQNTLYPMLIESNIMLGNREKALEYFNIFRTWTINNSQQIFQESLSEMEVKYETEKKEMRISTLEEEKQLMTRLSIMSIGVMLLGLVALCFLWRLTVQKHHLAKKQIELSEQEKQLAMQQVKQLEQEKRLVATQAVLDGEVQERVRLARDLHDGLGSLLAATKYNLTGIRKDSSCDTSDTDEFNTAINLLDESMREMRRIAHHLMPESLSSSGLKKATADFCSSVAHVKFAYFGDDTRFDPKMEVMVYRTMHELVSNALKHSNATYILVQIAIQNDSISLIVQDDGCGFDPSSESKGMGLANIRTRVAAYNGSLMVDSTPNVGTEVNVDISMKN